MISKIVFTYLFQLLMIHAAAGNNENSDNFDSMQTIKIKENNANFKSLNYTMDCIPINKNNLKFIRNDNNIFVINGNNLFMLNIPIENQNISHKSLGVIEKMDKEITDAQAIVWHENILLIIALQNRYHVYIRKNSDQLQPIDLIEKIPMYGQSKKLLLFDDHENLYCLIESTLQADEKSSMVRLFKWSNSLFTLLEMKTYHNVDHLSHCKTDQQTLILLTHNGNNHQKTFVQIYLFDNEQMKYVQNLHLSSIGVYVYQYDGQCFLMENEGITNDPVTSYVWKNNQFQKYRENNRLYNISEVSSSKDLIVIKNEKNLMAYLNPVFTKSVNLSVLMDNLINFDVEQRYVILFQEKQTGCLTIDIIEFNIENTLKETASLTENRECLIQLANQCRKLQPVIKLGTSKISALIPCTHNQTISKIVSNQPIFIKNGKIDKIKINSILHTTVQQLQKEILKIKERINHLKAERLRIKRESLTSDKKIKKLIIRNLRTDSNFFKDALLKSSDNKIHFKSKIFAKSLNTNKLALSAAKQDSVLSANVVATDSHIKVNHIPFVKHLTVRTINGLDWNEFMKSLYLKDLQTTITGDLIFNHNLFIKHLEAKSINHLTTNEFVTLNTDQTIESDIFITKFFAVNVHANTVNDINFKKDLATIDDRTFIKSPVKIAKSYVTGNLTLSDDETMSARHIIGTELEDLSQVYNAKVIIKGSLKLNRLILDRPTSSIFSKLGSFDLKTINDQYWLTNVDQTFDQITFRNSVKMPQIHTDYINNHPAAEYQLIDKNPIYPMNLIIQTASVIGNIYPSPDIQSKLSEISKNVIRHNSNNNKIIGHKTFIGNFVVDSFVCPTMNKLSENLYQKKKIQSELEFFSTKQFSQIRVIGNVISITGNLDILAFNEYNLFEFHKNALTINQPLAIDKIQFNNVYANSIQSNVINEIYVGDWIKMIEQSVGVNGSIREIRINGNVHFNADLFLKTINGIHLDEYLNQMITTQMGGQITNNIYFADTINIRRLYTHHIDNIEVNEWFINALQMDVPQTITGEWYIETVHANTLWANTINNVPLNKLIDVTAKVINIKSDIIATLINIDGNLYGQTLCSIKSIYDTINTLSLTRTNWPTIIVHGWAFWFDNKPSKMNLLLYQAVTNNTDQIITGRISLTKSTIIGQMWCKVQINNINLREIYTDALTSTLGEFQMISGTKHFSNNLHCNNVITENDLQIPIINNVDIIQLNGTIFRLSEQRNILSGMKTFATNPLIGKLWTKRTINGIYANDIVHVNSLIMLPAVAFHNIIYVNQSLNFVDCVNKLSFDFFLKNRIRVTGSLQEIHNVITFKNLICSGTIILPSINGIEPINIVVKNSNNMQEIVGEKTIIGNIVLNGPSSITNVNHKSLTETYTNALALNREENIRRFEIFGTVTLMQGITVRRHINDVNVQALMNWEPPTATEILKMSAASKEMARKTQMLYNNRTLKEIIMYLDFAPNIEIVKDYHSNRPITFAVSSVQSGEHCGLMHRCLCPFQYSIRVTPAYRIYINRQPYFDRRIILNSANLNVTIETSFQSSCLNETMKRNQTKIHWITEENKFRTSIIEYDKLIVSNGQLIDSDNSQFLVLLFPNGTITMSEFNTNKNNWIHSISMHNPWNNDIKSFSWHGHHILVVLTNTANKTLHGAAQLYYLQNSQFQPFQFIAGDYDLCDGTQIDDTNTHMMILGKIGTNILSIFRADLYQNKFRNYNFYQKLIFKSSIKSFTTFLVDNHTYIATVTSSGYFYLHRFNQIEGWTSATYGYFKNIEKIIPFKYLSKMYLFVSASDTATVMSYHHQIVYD